MEIMEPAGSQLTEDIIIEIVLRLPVKYIVQFRCVSKTWLGLITSPSFVSRHLNFVSKCPNSNSEYVLVKRIFQQPDADFDLRSINVLSSFSSSSVSSDTCNDNDEHSVVGVDLDVSFFPSMSVTILGPSNGILCLTNFYSDYFLCNPGIRQVKRVPTPPRFDYPPGRYPICEVAGFSYDPNADDYKIVRIMDLTDDGVHFWYPLFAAEIYCLSTDTWRQVRAKVPVQFLDNQPEFEILFDGAMHWAGGDAEAERDSILTFHFNSETFGNIGFPHPDVCPEIYHHSNDSILAVLDDSLALIIYPSFWNGLHGWQPPPLDGIDIWTMNQYGVTESWTKKHSIRPFPPLAGGGMVQIPLGILKNCMLLLQSTHGQLLSFDLNTQKIKEFQIYGLSLEKFEETRNLFSATLKIIQYKESLVSIQGEWSLANAQLRLGEENGDGENKVDEADGSTSEG